MEPENVLKFDDKESLEGTANEMIAVKIQNGVNAIKF